jgi:hypothetical protein
LGVERGDDRLELLTGEPLLAKNSNDGNASRELRRNQHRLADDGGGADSCHGIETCFPERRPVFTRCSTCW